MTDSFFIAYCILFIALFVWACVADSPAVQFFVVRALCMKKFSLKCTGKYRQDFIH